MIGVTVSSTANYARLLRLESLLKCYSHSDRGRSGKLMAEQIEAIDMKRIEATRATGFIGEE